MKAEGLTIMTHRCCMCPQKDSGSTTCKTGHPCRFVRTFVDDRGWRYFVRNTLNPNIYKTHYIRSDGNKRARASTAFQWRNSFDAAQEDLNTRAKQKRWKDSEGVPFLQTGEN